MRFRNLIAAVFPKVAYARCSFYSLVRSPLYSLLTCTTTDDFFAARDGGLRPVEELYFLLTRLSLFDLKPQPSSVFSLKEVAFVSFCLTLALLPSVVGWLRSSRSRCYLDLLVLFFKFSCDPTVFCVGPLPAWTTPKLSIYAPPLVTLVKVF